jgi:hypothetical protein
VLEKGLSSSFHSRAKILMLGSSKGFSHAACSGFLTIRAGGNTFITLFDGQFELNFTEKGGDRSDGFIP